MSAAPREAVEPVRITEVKSAADRSTFVRVQYRLNENDPAFVPPLLVDRKDFINPKKHPFYLHGAATQFIAWRGREAVGRIMASDDPNFNAVHDANVGMFGLFESIDDPEVAHALLDAAAGWLKARGRSEILGPIDYSTNYEIGLLIDGFDTPPRVMMNHNPPYYARLLESWGLEKAKDVFAWWVTSDLEIPERWRRVAERQAKRSGVVIRPLVMKDFDAEVAKIKDIYNSAWEKNWGAVKFTDAEFEHLAKDLKMLADPDLALMAEVDGKPVGFSLALPDLNEALRIAGIDGRLFPFGLPIGLVKLLRSIKKVKSLRLVILGVLEGYRRRGITELLIMRTVDVGKQKGFTGCEMSWTLEDNDLINRPIEALGSEKYKTYRVYQKPL